MSVDSLRRRRVEGDVILDVLAFLVCVVEGGVDGDGGVEEVNVEVEVEVERIRG
jgi:hypothetical protein